MPRSADFRLLLALFGSLSLAATATAQNVIFNSNGFESPGYTTANLVPQQGFSAFLPNVPFQVPVSPATIAAIEAAGIVQNVTAAPGGSQAFRVVGTGLQNTEPNGYGRFNFWYKSNSFAAGYNPQAQATPYVQLRFTHRTSGAIALPSDIPLAGGYAEVYTNTGTQQTLSPILINALGGVSVGTTAAAGGGDQSVSTSFASPVFGREAWQEVLAEFNFATQTFRVYANGSTTPLTFYNDGNNPVNGIIDVPFRNSFGASARIAEYGMLATFGDDGTGVAAQPQNNFFVDDYMLTASVNSVVVPVPEPAAALACGLVLLGGYRLRRRASK